MDAVRARGFRGTALPPFHALTVTVPGAAAAWEDAVKQWGKLPLAQVRCICRVPRATPTRHDCAPLLLQACQLPEWQEVQCSRSSFRRILHQAPLAMSRTVRVYAQVRHV